MNILTDCIRADAEYSQLLGAVRENFRSKALPILANGLCEGASDAFCVALLEDASAFSPHCALIICPEERNACILWSFWSASDTGLPFFLQGICLFMISLPPMNTSMRGFWCCPDW